MARACRYQPCRHKPKPGAKAASGKFIKVFGWIVMARRCNTKACDAVADLAQAQAQPGGGSRSVEAGFLQHPDQDASLLMVQKVLQVFRNSHGLLGHVGTAAVMPLGSPIGSNKGLKTIDFLEIIIDQSTVPVIVDAGIGAPSDAAKAMEIGADAVLVNTAIAVAGNPKLMAEAFKEAVIAGRKAFEAKIANQHNYAVASSPLTAFLYH